MGRLEVSLQKFAERMVAVKETRLRSLSKSTIWRILGVLILAIITYAYTQEWVATGLITIIHHGIFLFVFYFHERLWLKIRRIKSLIARSILKMFTYETFCGNVILGTITYCVTGSWKQMTAITLTYIGIKHMVYIFNEFIWDKIKIGKGITMLVAVLLFSGLSFGDYWNTGAIKVENFGVDVEIRMTADMYYKHIHFDWHHKLNRYFTLTLSERESHIKKTTWKVEHRPMLNLAYKNGVLKNRSRVTLRIREGENIWRFRNKITVTPAFWFLAHEAFFEKRKWFRNRYYVGANVSKNLSIFFIRQQTRGEGIWVVGTKLIVRF